MKVQQLPQIDQQTSIPSNAPCQIQTFLNQETFVIRCQLNYHPNFQGLEFSPSFYSQVNKDQIDRKYDKSIRNSSESYIDNATLTEKANEILTSLLNKIGQQLVETDDKWRLLRYQNGHFIQHCDFYRQLEPLVHFGTQIWLPPKNICSYKGGVLITKDKEIHQIIPAENQWTFIVLPLGVLHEISQVEGIRISYVKPIYIKRIQAIYSIPMTSNYGEDCPGPTCPMD